LFEISAWRQLKLENVLYDWTLPQPKITSYILKVWIRKYIINLSLFSFSNLALAHHRLLFMDLSMCCTSWSSLIPVCV